MVPVYNVREYLKECVESVLNQTYRDFELILIDDGSTDGSGLICDELAGKDQRIRVLHQENAGVSAARNRGLEASSGAAILFIDADDDLEPDMFAQMLYAMDKENADVVCCGYSCIYHGAEQSRIPERRLLDGKEALAGIFSDEIFVTVWNKIFRREVIFDDKNNYKAFPVGVTNGEDIVWLSGVISGISRMYCVDSEFYHWRDRSDSAADNWELRTDDRALSEIFSLEKTAQICRPISKESYYQACRRYYGFLTVKIKNPELKENPAGFKLVRKKLIRLAIIFPAKTLREYLSRWKTAGLSLIKAGKQ